jgi:hypothetical protein
MAASNEITQLNVGDYVSWGSAISKYLKSTFQSQLESGKTAFDELLETAARAVKMTDEDVAPAGIELPNGWVNLDDLKRRQVVSTWFKEEFKGRFLKGRIGMDCTVFFMIMDDPECHTFLMGRLRTKCLERSASRQSTSVDNYFSVESVKARIAGQDNVPIQ